LVCLSTFIIQDTPADYISCNYCVAVPLSHATLALAQSAMVLLRPVVVFPASRIRSSIFSHTRGTPEASWQKFRLYNSKEDENNFPGVQFLYCIITLLINCIYSIYFVQGKYCMSVRCFRCSMFCRAMPRNCDSGSRLF
jgi:hypothetical protein